MTSSDGFYSDDVWEAEKRRVVFIRDSTRSTQALTAQCFCQELTEEHTRACGLWDLVSTLACLVVAAADELLADLGSGLKRRVLKELVEEWHGAVLLATQAYRDEKPSS